MKLRWLAALAALLLAIALTVAYDRSLLHFLGWDGQASDNYAAWSGSVPALFTLIGLSTIISGIWHGLNCHQQGCWRYGRHKVNGSPWCNLHQDSARPGRTELEILESIERLLTAMAGTGSQR